MNPICSFDVFDTCLTRRMAALSAVMYETGAKVLARLGIARDRFLLEDFVAARIEAEQAARRHAKREDVALDDIWRLLIPSMGWPFDASLSNCELEAEAEVLVPILSTRAEVQAARRRSKRILFVSDMYLPTEFIERQLRQHGFAEPGDGIYVSGAIGKTKASGNLFRHILQQENVSAENMFHSGDHPHSDYAVPRSLGIAARLCEPAKLTPTELDLLKTDGDLHTAARIAGTMRAFRVGAERRGDEAVHELTAQFIGPYTLALAVWLLQRAKESGVKRLYFLSRDGQLLCKVADKLASHFGGIDCRYLYVSRQALFLPSAGDLSPAGMPWMRREFEEPRLKKLLAKIELNYEDVESVLGSMAGDQGADYRLKSEADWTLFWKALNAEPLKTKIQSLVSARRDAARKYFDSVGLFDDVSWAIVDLGWTLTCQRALANLLKQWGWQKIIRGYYFGLVKQRVGRAEAGIAEALFYKPAFDFPAATRLNAVFDRITLLEHIVGCADHPTVHHHEELAGGKMGAAYAQDVDKFTLEFCRQVHAATLDFVSQSQNLVEDFKDTTVCQNTLASLVTNFFTFPAEKPARALVGLSATDDQNGLNPLPIVKELDWKKTLLPLTSQPAEIFQQINSFWLEGSLAITPLKVRRFLNLTQRAANRLHRLRHAKS